MVAMGNDGGGGDLRRVFVAVGDFGDRLRRTTADGMLQSGAPMRSMYNTDCSMIVLVISPSAVRPSVRPPVRKVFAF